MKLSFKLQDDQSSLLKAKIPISIFSHPFISSLTTTTTPSTDKNDNKSSTNPSFSLSTNFPSGPSLKLSYSPSTTATSPFALSLKSGLGLFGCPRDSPLIFSANFCLSSSSPCTVFPTFSLQFKPQFGDFSLRKSTSSSHGLELDSVSRSIPEPPLQPGSASNSDFGDGFASDGTMAWQEVKLEPRSGGDGGFPNPNSNFVNDLYSNAGIGFAPERSLVGRDIKKGGVLNGIALTARTLLPVTKRVVVNFRWGVNIPADIRAKMPYLTVSKIGIERVEEVKKEEKKSVQSNSGDLDMLKGICFWMRRDMELLEKENREMKQSLEDMRLKVSARKSRGESESLGRKVSTPLVENSVEYERWRSKKNGGEENIGRESKKNSSKMSDMESELQKAIKAASA